MASQPPSFPGIYERPRRGRSGKEWVLRVILAVLIAALGIVVGGLIRGDWGPWKTTTPAATSTAASGSSEVLHTGCAAGGSVTDAVVAADTEGSTAPLRRMASGTSWQSVTAMQTLGAPYRAVAGDTTELIHGYALAIAAGEGLTPIENALTKLSADCGAAGAEAFPVGQSGA